MTDEREGGPDLSPHTRELVRLLAFVLAGGFALSAATLAVCRVSGAGGLDGDCRGLVPALEAKQSEALQTLLTLLAGAGLAGRR